MTFFTEVGVGFAANIATNIVTSNFDKITSIFTETAERLSDGSLGIFIFGPQGTGKSTLLDIISGRRSLNDTPLPYSSSHANECQKLDGHLYFRAFAGPGQEALQNIHWPSLYNKMATYKRVICVFCASYGCHALFEEGFDSIAKSSLNVREDLIVQDYLNSKRQEESAIFSDFATKLAAVPGPMGLMLLVTKQDLWWGNRAEVARHYGRGAFATHLKKLAEAKKATGLVVDTQSASLSIQNLLTSDQRLIVPTASGYDSLLQLANFQRFDHKLEEMASALARK